MKNLLFDKDTYINGRIKDINVKNVNGGWRLNMPPNGGQIYDIASVSCGQTSRGAGGVVRNYTERGDAASICILNIAHALGRFV